MKTTINNYNVKLFDYDLVKDKIMMKLINQEANEKLLENVPHFYFLDLAIIFYYRIFDDEHNALNIIVNNDHLTALGIEKDILYKNSIKNTRLSLGIEVMSLEDMIAGLALYDENKILRETARYDKNSTRFDMRLKESDLPVYVMTNSVHTNGAVCMLYKEIDKFADFLDDDIYIIPSSIHEVLLVPASSGIEKMSLLNILNSVNKKELPPDELLSDNIYTYSRKEKRILL